MLPVSTFVLLVITTTSFLVNADTPAERAKALLAEMDLDQKLSMVFKKRFFMF